MLRSIIIVILLIPYSIIAIILSLFGLFVGLFSSTLRFQIAKGLTKAASNLFFIFSGADLNIKGLNNIPKDGAVLFVGNHKSYIDIPLMIKYVNSPLAFIAKDNLKKVPILNLIMMVLGCLFLDRENVRQALVVIKAGIKKLEHGESLLIFPEGTRSKTDDLLPFKQGSLKLAEKSHVPIVPFALKGTNDVFGNNGFKTKPEKVWLTFGSPIYLDQLEPDTRKRSASYVQNIISEMYHTMV